MMLTQKVSIRQLSKKRPMLSFCDAKKNLSDFFTTFSGGN